MPEETAIWTEKYRPKRFSEVLGQREIVEKVEAFVKQGNMPHLLFAGPAGIGKTTLSLVIARQLYGDEWRGNFLELNASDERGIDVVRVKVKDFARTRAIGDVPFKIIYLDECFGYDTKVIIRTAEGIEERRIGDVVENVDAGEVLSVDESGRLVFTPINGFLKLPHKKEQGFYRVTLNGRVIEATGNHLLLTPDGWKRVDALTRGEQLLCPPETPPVRQEGPLRPVQYVLTGLPQEIKAKERYISRSPEKRVVELLAVLPEGLTRRDLTTLSGIASPKLSSILSPKKNAYYLSLLHHGLVRNDDGRFTLVGEKNAALDRLSRIKRAQNSRNQEYIRTTLAEKGLYPLQPEKAAIVARLAGHLFGDGSLSLKTRSLFFSGKEEDMRLIKEDLAALGFPSLGNIRETRWRNGRCWSFAESKIALLSAFYSLGVPVGKKTDTFVRVPGWVLRGDAVVKREFLAALFGAEGTTPSFRGRTIKPVVVAQAKRRDLEENLRDYLDQLRLLLEGFGIAVGTRITTRTKNVRADGTESIEGKLWVKNSRANIIRFLEHVGYRYADEKAAEAARVLRYLRWKEALGRDVYRFHAPHYAVWKEKYLVGDSAFHYVIGLEKIDDPAAVYCLQTANQRFIADDVVVHNCDALTKEAQQALRRTMENYTQTCRFILSCNYSSKIIDPIQSRCTVFRFKPLAKEEIVRIIKNVAKSEGLTIDAKGEDALFTVSNGDVRRVENLLQACAALSKKVTEDVVYSIASYAKPKEIASLLELAKKGDFAGAKKQLLTVQLEYGLSGSDIIKQLQAAVWQLNGVDDRKKLEMVKQCGEAEFRMVEGSDEFLQLEALLAAFTLALQN